MRILVTNDDGILAKGIQELVKGLKGLGEIFVIAPASEKSACGHGITVRQPIRVREYFGPSKNVKAWAVEGTPADCVKMGITTLLDKAPDIVISGINRGSNLGTDVLYSGTVSAALEGIILGVPSLSISLDSFTLEDYTIASQVANILCQDMLNKQLAPDTLLNVNVPAVPKSEIKGWKVTKLGERKYENIFEHRQDPHGNDYYWLAGQIVPPATQDEDLDVVAAEKNYISVTPIHFDLTNYKIMDQVKKWGIETKGI